MEAEPSSDRGIELALILLKSRPDAGGVDGTPSRIEEIP
jgi:hypothetical protein